MDGLQTRRLVDWYPNQDARKRAHYLFAHRLLPPMAHANPANVFAPLVDGDDDTRRIQWLWCMADGSPDVFGMVADVRAWSATVAGRRAVVVEMPRPETNPPPCAFMVAIVEGATVSVAGVATDVRTITLERVADGLPFGAPPGRNPRAAGRSGLDTSAEGILCEWRARGDHVNYGSIVAVDRCAFLQAVGEVLAQEDCAPPPRPLPRSLREVREEFGLAVVELAARYKGYQIALMCSGLEADWNAEIATVAAQLGALRDVEVRLAAANRHQAVLNRVIVRMEYLRQTGDTDPLSRARLAHE